MKVKKYYQVSGFQLFLMAILTGIVAGALVNINMLTKEYLQTPVVTMSKDEKCISVVNYRNGDAFTCNDVGVILRTYRKKIE